MAIEWAPGIAISDVPLRKVVRRSSAINNGWDRTNKNPNGFCGGESNGELEFMMVANMDPNVTVIRPQPCTEPFWHDGKRRHMTPDFAIIECADSLLFEVKSRRQYAKPHLAERLAAFGAMIEARGWPFFVTLKEDILDDPRYPNVRDVWRRFRPSFNDQQRMAVQDTVWTRERSIADVLAEITSSMGGHAPRFEDVLSLAANGHIFIDLDTPIGIGSIIRAADREALPRSLLPRRRPADDLALEAAA